MELAAQLIQQGHLCEAQLTLAERIQKQKGGNLLDIVVDLGFVDAKLAYDVVAQQSQTTRVHIATLRVDPRVAALIPYETSMRLKALALEVNQTTLKVAFANPLDLLAIDTVAQLTDMVVEVCVAPEKEIIAYLDEHFSSGHGVEESIDRAMAENVDHSKSWNSVDHTALDIQQADEAEAPVIQLVSKVISNAVRSGASDIHFEPDERVMRIRARVDGSLRQDVLIPKAMQSSVITRIKILADLDVAENRLPQDGRATLKYHHRTINLRVSALPTAFGENVVIRILDPESHIQDFKDMGMLEDTESELLHIALLKQISNLETSVFTLEDPIEHRMSLVRQTQINEEIGLTFSRGLRSLLRQDPDVILVGETRDQETAQLMIRAALTGHLVFTTLHTNDSAGAIPRLVDMGIEPFLLPASLIGVGAQRLVKKLCPQCSKIVEQPSPYRGFLADSKDCGG
ncbi:MAG: type II/IV secretion system protein [Verrucomicrobia bacterium]|nr:type II/IV secretion system protein [Verrucomicrobiota bacterium]